ncbi:MAG: hypothetical protein IIB60_00505 [Planctomycetes bacterium]|nr:hypothetical protein [Planctomycetota bacterium]
MERLRQLLNQITAQLGLLTLSQRLAMGLSAALIVVSLLWLMQWSTTPDLVPLVNYEFSYDELTSAEGAIEAAGLPYQTRGKRIYVRAVDQPNLVRILHTASALPEGSLYDMATVVAGDNPFESPESRKFKQNYAMGNELAKIIATSPHVKRAAVLINATTKRRLGGRSDVPTASVNLTLTPGREMTQETVEWAAKLVAGAVSGLKPYNVYVTDSQTMRSYNVPHPDDPAGIDFLGKLKKREAHYVSKIMDKLGDIPGLRVSVTVELDTSKLVRQKTTYHKAELKVESTENTKQTSGAQPTEPGVQPNLGQAVVAASSGGGQTSDKNDTEFFPPTLDETVTEEKMPWGTKRVTATVGIPRSFLVSVFRAKHPDAGESPSDGDPQFTAVRDEQVSRVRASVERIVMASTPDDVDVDVYPDMTWTADGGGFAVTPGIAAATATGSDSLDVMGLAGKYGPQAGLALLAVMSLVMMMRVVRKSSEALGPGKSGKVLVEEPLEEEQMLAGSPPVGEAPMTEGFLVGRELGEDALRSQELNAEVTRMVEEDPDGSADLIRRWIQDPT